MPRSLPFVFLSVAILSGGCSKGAKEVVETPPSPTYVDLAQQRFGKNAELVDNPTGEYVLVVSKMKQTAQNPQPTVSFFVYGKKQNDVVYEDTELVGSVAWLDEYYLEVVVIPGIVKVDAEPGGVTYRVDVRTGSRVEMKAPSRR